MLSHISLRNFIFLSTPSARRATVRRTAMCRPAAYFYPRPPRGGRPIVVMLSPGCFGISIHALREEGDGPRHTSSVDMYQFLSTPSARRATVAPLPLRGIPDISIHALREEGDVAVGLYTLVIEISIHALREEGDFQAARSSRPPANFYPRPPRGGRPDERRGRRNRKRISIHALREEGDSKNGEKHLRFCFIIKRSAQIWKSFSKNIRKKSRDLHRMP